MIAPSAAPRYSQRLTTTFMSRHRTSRTAGPRIFTAGRVFTVVLLAAAVWLGSGLVSRMVLAYRLSSEVTALQAENNKIAQENRDYAQQLQSLARPDGAEEQARQHNYVRPDEKVYVVTQPSPTASPSASPPTAKRSPDRPRASFWNDFLNALRAPFR
ncbi:MAG: septum formation initiator family protein [Candidatus Dormibacteria bacterium]